MNLREALERIIALTPPEETVVSTNDFGETMSIRQPRYDQALEEAKRIAKEALDDDS
jgi:hypothetical protein